jgi:hypothetical protein
MSARSNPADDRTGYAVYRRRRDRAQGKMEGEPRSEVELPLSALWAGYARRRLVRRGPPIRPTYLGDNLIWARPHGCSPICSSGSARDLRR